MKKVEFPIHKQEWSPSLIPGPVALITTRDVAQVPNVAPKSWLQMVAFSPPTLMFSGSAGRTTENNILATGDFAVNFVDVAMAHTVHECLRWSGAERIEKMGIRLVPARAIGAPLVEQCRAHLECVLRGTHEIGSGLVVFGEIVSASIDEELLALPRAQRYAAFRQALFLEDGLDGSVRDTWSPEGARGDGFGPWLRYVITLVRTDMPMTEALARRHVAHLKALDRQGRLVLCGPFEDGKGGMVIIRASSLDEATRIAESDPFVREGAETVSVRAWELSCEENSHMGLG
jgi:uncharacterized protein